VIDQIVFAIQNGGSNVIRHQTGSLYKAYGAWHVKFYASVMKEGKSVRAQRSHRLCSSARPKKEAKRIAADFIAKVNLADKRVIVGSDLTIAEFFEKRFIPYCEELVPVKGRVRQKPSTVMGHQQKWNQFLRTHFGSMTLQEYDADRGNDFLQSLKDRHSLTILRGIKSLATAIFKLATFDRRIKASPWRDVQIPDDAVDSEETEAYTREEAEDMITALQDHADCQLILALACFEGLRPGEIAALKWSDVDSEFKWLSIRRSVVRGIVDTPKTESSVADIPLISIVPDMFRQWRNECKKSKEDWVFPSRNDKPVNLPNLVWRVIRPHVEGERHTHQGKPVKCMRCEKLPQGTSHKWKTMYAGRRCAATLAISLSSGNYQLAQSLLRHASYKTTLDIYDKGLTNEQFRDKLIAAYLPKHLPQ
jgi:integrase